MVETKNVYGDVSKPILLYLGGWTSIYQLFGFIWGSLGSTKVLTHSHMIINDHLKWFFQPSISLYIYNHICRWFPYDNQRSSNSSQKHIIIWYHGWNQRWIPDNPLIISFSSQKHPRKIPWLHQVLEPSSDHVVTEVLGFFDGLLWTGHRNRWYTWLYLFNMVIFHSFNVYQRVGWIRSGWI